MSEPTTGETAGDHVLGVSGSLRKAIKDSGISISELARRTGVARQAINRFLSGERGLTTETVDKLCVELRLVLHTDESPEESSSPPAQANPQHEHAMSEMTANLQLMKTKLYLITVKDRRPYASSPIWYDLLARTKHIILLYDFLQEVRGFGSDKQSAAIQCLMLSILEMNPNRDRLLNNEHLPGFLRYLVTQDDDPICIGSLGAILSTSDIHAWVCSFPRPDPENSDEVGE